MLLVRTTKTRTDMSWKARELCQAKSIREHKAQGGNIDETKNNRNEEGQHTH